MEKLIFYAEVCVNLRKAVLSRLTSEEFTAMNDVRARLEDWDKVNKIFDREHAGPVVTGDGDTNGNGTQISTNTSGFNLRIEKR